MAVLSRQVITNVGAATSAAVRVRPQNPLQIGFGVSLAAGNATVQFCFDEALAVWFDHPDVTAVVVNTAGNIDKPITALRLVSTAAAVLTINQYV